MTETTVLLAWESGHNLGHIASLATLSRGFEARGMRTVWAVAADKQNDIPEEFKPETIRATPGITANPEFRNLGSALLSYAELLVAQGLGNPQALILGLKAWFDILDEISPALVVIDSAPMALVATYLRGIPCVQVSNGFDAPPDNFPLFGFGMRGPLIERANQRFVDLLNLNVARAGEILTGRKGASLTECLRSTLRLVARIPEVDPYGERVEVDYVGPLGWPGKAISPEWPSGNAAEPKVFAYLRGLSAVPVLRALEAAGLAILCCCPDSKLEPQKFSSKVNLVRTPVDIEEVFQQASAIVSYGGTTLVCQALLAGLPQLIVPSDVEKWMTARRLAEAGTGILARTSGELPSAVAALMASDTAKCAQAVATRYQATNWEKRLWDAMEATLERLGTTMEHV